MFGVEEQGAWHNVITLGKLSFEYSADCESIWLLPGENFPRRHVSACRASDLWLPVSGIPVDSSAPMVFQLSANSIAVIVEEKE
jgi:hypothetical protein